MKKQSGIMLLLSSCSWFPTALSAHTTPALSPHAHHCPLGEGLCPPGVSEHWMVFAAPWWAWGLVGFGLLVLACLLANHNRSVNRVPSTASQSSQ